MWRWALSACLAALIGSACVEVRLVPGSSSSGGGGASTTTTTTAGGGGAGGSVPTCGCDKLDVLVVIDNSDSLQDNIISLVNVFLQLDDTVFEVAQRACSFHFGVVTATAKDNQVPECNLLGALSYTGADGEDCFLGQGGAGGQADPGRRFATNEDIELDGNGNPTLPVASCLVTTGSTDDGNERIIEAAINAVSDDGLNGVNGCNEGFLRDDAGLLLLLITDRDDVRSDINDDLVPDNPSLWYPAFLAARGGDNSRDAALGLVPPASGEDCEGGFGTNIQAFFSSFPDGRHNTANICGTTINEVRSKVLELADVVCPLSSE